MGKKEETIRFKSPTFSTEKLWDEGNLSVILLVGFLLILITITAIFAFNLKGYNTLYLIILIIVFFIIFLSFMLEPQILKEIHKKETKVIEKQVIKEVPKQVIHEVEKRIYYTKTPKTKKPARKYQYVGSSKSKSYHNKKCRFSKLIKGKHRLTSRTQGFFQLKRFKPCKVCITKQVKR